MDFNTKRQQETQLKNAYTGTVPLHRFLILFFTLFAFFSPAQAGNSLPVATSKFAGVFQTNDSDGSDCVNPNKLSNSCTCPGATDPAYRLRILNDSNGPGTITGGNFQVCSRGETATNGEFFGTYQSDDPVPGGLACRTKNLMTNACSCPAGSTDLSYRGLVDTATGGMIGTNLHICTKITATPTYYGGAYQRKDTNVCTHANPATGACSCPSNFIAQPIRSLVNTANDADSASTISVCVPPLPTAQPATKMVAICPAVLPDVVADPTGNIPATAAIQACVYATNPQNGILALPAGTYLVENKITIDRAMSLRTATVTDTAVQCGKDLPCATLLAAPNFSGINGMLWVPFTNNVVIDHIAIDGNRWARKNSLSWGYCSNPNKPGGFEGTLYGYNAQVNNCADCKLTNSYSARALCGTGLEWNGDRATINNNWFFRNGDHETNLHWADGLSIHNANNSAITNNTIIDGTDVGFIAGQLQNSYVRANMVLQQRKRAYAAFMLNSYGSSSLGNFTNADVSSNYIACEPGKCFYAVNMGNHAWNPANPPIWGGTFANNTVIGGVIGLNVDGVGGVGLAPMTISGNTLTANQPNSTQNLCQGKYVTSSRYNVSFDSTVAGTQQWNTRQETHTCIGD